MLHKNNIVYGTEDACYHDHEGYDVTLTNNIFVKQGTLTASHGDGALRSAVPTDKPGQHWHAAFKLHGNIVTSTGPAPLFSPGSDVQWALSSFDQNLYWLEGKDDHDPLFPSNQTLAEWQHAGVSGGKLGGQDKHSVVADPQFTNAAEHDYTLVPGSPAFDLGFTQIDISTVGPRPPRREL